jgi:hypothetical protein
VETRLDIRDFIIDEEARRRMGLAGRRPREQVLIMERDGTVELAVFVDPTALANLASHDPVRALGDHNLADFCLTVEGVSHFVYFVVRARAGQPVSALELELQAEIDKYVACLLTHWARHDRAPERLRERLFERVRLAADPSAEERDRYRAAHAEAARYVRSLERRYVRPRRIAGMLGELRHFYRLGVRDKLDHISKAA